MIPIEARGNRSTSDAGTGFASMNPHACPGSGHRVRTKVCQWVRHPTRAGGCNIRSGPVDWPFPEKSSPMPPLHPLFMLSPPVRLTLIWLSKAAGDTNCCPYGITRGIYNSSPTQAIEDRRNIVRHLKTLERLEYARIGGRDPRRRQRCTCSLTDQGNQAAEVASEWLACVSSGQKYAGGV